MIYIIILDFLICSQWNGWAIAIYFTLLSIQNDILILFYFAF